MLLPVCVLAMSDSMQKLTVVLTHCRWTIKTSMQEALHSDLDLARIRSVTPLCSPLTEDVHPLQGFLSVGDKVREALPVCRLLCHSPPCWLSLSADLLFCLHSTAPVITSNRIKAAVSRQLICQQILKPSYC